MKKPIKPRSKTDDAALSKRELATARPLRNALPDLAAFGRTRARKGEPTKQAVSVRLSPEVVTFFKAKGAGWQTRMDNALKAFVQVAQDGTPRQK
ncbi:MAG: BrnA antitoxin family protein [Alphaproteobacteria bacterium]|nr:BrnA antitoxin family protein [Alphaproteobacteria bacterium]